MAEKPIYDIHVFCCTNRRSDDHPRGSCAARGSEALRDYMKEKTKALKQYRLRINTAGCLDFCESGPMMVIYPEGAWYSYHSKEDIDAIIEQHLIGGKKVERLLFVPMRSS